MSTINVNSQKLFDEGMSQGFISPEAHAILSKCSFAAINQALAMDQDLLDAKRFDLLIILPDDSSSITGLDDNVGNIIGPEAVCEGQRLIISSFLGSRKTHHEGVVVLTWPLNSRAPLQPLTSLLDPNLTLLANNSNYSANGGTPLYDHVTLALATALAFKVLVNQLASADCRGTIMVVSDGMDEHSRTFGASDVAKLVKEVSGGDGGSSSIGVSFMGIESRSQPIDFKKIAKEMGIEDKYIFITTSDPKLIRNTFGKMSQSAVSDLQLTPAV